ncbi:MAG TPA: hypothetical protein PKL56_01860 [Cyclobacteriaceae bacterium]|nr:hypothetical protein [Cyclobacteriaceae bacterium]HMV10956.1 hypothetical protein [Cyclobacteriaceae bacterium]HMV89140.1 hypothetical protein [Cyclobacteriaceae bacterium]HMX00025.1 hypothetical protein [Cyclobacteriaceae bacterium]HMX49113.1 hypothetical protein [Cyclobacteriaceae bacterium]
MKRILAIVLLFVLTACSHQSKERQQIDSLIALEQSKHTYDELGEPQAVIPFGVITSDREIFADGIVPWANLANPEEDLPQLVSKDMVVIYDTVVTVVIDYPLTNPYEFRLISPDGFTCGKLLTAISKQYKFVYAEEEKTATIKTLPVEQREILNRNTTNGKYGIWGHDLTDLDLSEVHVHKAPDGRIVLLLQVES